MCRLTCDMPHTASLSDVTRSNASCIPSSPSTPSKPSSFQCPAFCGSPLVLPHWLPLLPPISIFEIEITIGRLTLIGLESYFVKFSSIKTNFSPLCIFKILLGQTFLWLEPSSLQIGFICSPPFSFMRKQPRRRQ